jgi:hypothetical protein
VFVCTHARREEIDLAFVNWISPARIARKYRVSRDSIYRHAHALSLFDKRRRNVRTALERIIEKAGEVNVGAAASCAPDRHDNGPQVGPESLSDVP